MRNKLYVAITLLSGLFIGGTIVGAYFLGAQSHQSDPIPQSNRQKDPILRPKISVSEIAPRQSPLDQSPESEESPKPQTSAHAADTQLTKAITKDREKAEAILELTLLRFDRDEDFDAALKGLMRAKEIDPDFTLPLYALGKLYERQELWAQAEKWFNLYCEIDRESDRYAEVQVRLIDIGRLAKLDATAEGRRKRKFLSIVDEAKLRYEANELNAAIKLASSAIRTDPTRWEAYVIGASALAKQNRYKEATNALTYAIERVHSSNRVDVETALKFCSDQARAQEFAAEGKQAVKTNQYEKAGTAFSEAFTLAPQREDWGLAAAMSFASSKHITRCLPLLNRLADSTNTSIVSQTKRQLQLLIPILQQEWAETLATTDRAASNNDFTAILLALENKLPLAYALSSSNRDFVSIVLERRVYAHKKLGNSSKVKTACLKWLAHAEQVGKTMPTELKTPLEQLAIAYAQLGDFRNAMLSRKRILEVVGTVAGEKRAGILGTANLNLGYAYGFIGLKQQALLAFKEAWRLNRNPYAAIQLHIHRNQGSSNGPDSSGEIDEVLNSKSISPWILALADYVRGGRTWEQLEKAVLPCNESEMYRRLCEAYYYRGERELRLGKDKQQAMEHFKASIATGASGVSERLSAIAQLMQHYDSKDLPEGDIVFVKQIASQVTKLKNAQKHVELTSRLQDSQNSYRMTLAPYGINFLNAFTPNEVSQIQDLTQGALTLPPGESTKAFDQASKLVASAAQKARSMYVKALGNLEQINAHPNQKFILTAQELDAILMEIMKRDEAGNSLTISNGVIKVHRGEALWYETRVSSIISTRIRRAPQSKSYLFLQCKPNSVRYPQSNRTEDMMGLLNVHMSNTALLGTFEDYWKNRIELESR